jgi:hypothetical protein
MEARNNNLSYLYTFCLVFSQERSTAMAGLRVSTATATTASASTVLASPATAAAARDTSNVSDCGLFRQRKDVTTVTLASLAMMRQGTQETTGALASLVIENSTRSQCTASQTYFSSRPRLSAFATW